MMVKEPMVIVNFKVTPHEHKLIERHAKKAKMTISDYVRTTLYLDMVMAGDLEAIRLVGGKLRDRLAEKLRSLRLVPGDTGDKAEA
jgi:hypothetical protein